MAEAIDPIENICSYFFMFQRLQYDAVLLKLIFFQSFLKRFEIEKRGVMMI